jgi:hypothetical protein
MLRKNSFLLLLAACACTNIFAQDSTAKESPLKISGSVDAYYRYNFDNTPQWRPGVQ